MNISYLQSSVSSHLFNTCLHENKLPNNFLGIFPREFIGTITNISHTIHAYIYKTDDGIIAFLVSGFVEGVYSFSEDKLILRHDHSAIAPKKDEICMRLLDFKNKVIAASSQSNPHDLYILSGSQSHPSHYLWNHLSGLYYFFTACDHAKIDKILVVNGNQQYGKIACLFPEISKKIEEVDPSYAHLPIFSAHRIIEPYYLMGVPMGIRSRIARAAGINLFEEVRHGVDGRFVVSLGPRISDRSCLNKLDCYEALFAICANNKIDKLDVILDISSRLDNMRYLPDPGLVNELKTQLGRLAARHLSSYSIYMIYDEPFESSLNKLSKAHFGLYEWGGGLAKFSWILGKPCVVTCPSDVSSRLCDSLMTRSCWGTYIHECSRSLPYIASNVADSCSKNSRGNAAFLMDYKVSIPSLKDCVSRCIHETLEVEIKNSMFLS